MHDLPKAKKDLEEKLRSLLSHDLNTPLTTISGYSQLLKTKLPLQEEKLHAYTTSILEESRKLEELIKEAHEIFVKILEYNQNPEQT